MFATSYSDGKTKKGQRDKSINLLVEGVFTKCLPLTNLTYKPIKKSLEDEYTLSATTCATNPYASKILLTNLYARFSPVTGSTQSSISFGMEMTIYASSNSTAPSSIWS